MRFRFSSILSHMLALILIPVIIAFIVVGVFLMSIVTESMHGYISREIESEAFLAGEKINNFVIKNIAIAEQVNYNNYIKNYFRTVKSDDDTTANVFYRDVLATIDEIAANHDAIDCAWVSDVDTGVTFYGDACPWQSDSGWDVSARAWYRPVVIEKRTIITDPYDSPSTGEPVVSIVSPITDENSGDVIGVFGADFNLSALASCVSAIKIGRGGFCVIITADRHVVYHPDPQFMFAPLSQTPYYPAAEQTIAQGQSSFTFNYQDAAQMGCVISIPDYGWYVLCQVPMAEVTAQSYQIRTYILYAFAFSIFLLILIIIYVSIKITNPIKELTVAAQYIAEGRFDVSLGIDSNDEIGQLAKAFGRTIKQLVTYRGYIDEAKKARQVQAENMELIRMAKEAAEQANRSKTEFIANISHEIRTPMHTITGLAEILLRNPNSSQNVMYIQNIKKSSQIMLGLLNDVLDFSRIENGRMELVYSHIMLSSLLYDVSVMVQTKIGDKPIAYKLNVDETLPAEIIVDELRLKQIIMNLLNNAVKYTRQGEISLTVTGQVVDDEALLNFDVADTGIGIKPQDLNSLFESFIRVDTTRNRSIEGAGLGLAIAKQLVTMMGGNISVKSEYGVGSTFSFSIVTTVGSKQQIGAESSTYGTPEEDEVFMPSFTAKANVLIVDDNIVNLHVVQALLQPYQMNTDIAASGREAIDLTQHKHFDIIFMDHMMPEMDGVEAVERIRSDDENPNRDAPIVALTANAVSGAKQMFLQSGFNDFLGKPIDLQRMDGILRKWLGDLIEDPTAEQTQAIRGERDLRIDGVDTEKGIRNLGGNFEMYKTVLQSYCEDVNKRLDELYPLSETNMELFATSVHAIKGASYNIGAIRAGDVAYELEKAAKSKDKTFVDANLPRLTQQLVTLLESLESALERCNQPTEDALETPDENTAVNEELINTLIDFEQSIRIADITQAETLLMKLEGMFKGQYSEKLEETAALLRAFNYDDAAEIAAEILERIRGYDEQGNDS